MSNGEELWKFKKELFRAIQRCSLFFKNMDTPGLAILRNISKIFLMDDFVRDRGKNRKPQQQLLCLNTMFLIKIFLK